MNTKIKFLLHEWHYVIVFTIVLLVAVLSLVWYQRGDDWKTLLPIVGGAVSLIYIFQKQQLEEAVLFKELFSEFNDRYESLNDELNRIRVLPQGQWSEEQHAILEEYFNLCSEEYLYFIKGFIYQEVWDSWVNGMRIYFSVDDIKSKWLADQESNSGYGFNIEREISRVNKMRPLRDIES